ncbi:MAG: PLDc N-terminal domain-containing protein [Psychroflexus halocasei]|uniref:PLDc N-terminal domain-containing protein n=1 Tax=Psychroflexus sp. S27 TaxID=1982757 RepID=UPI0012908B20
MLLNYIILGLLYDRLFIYVLYGVLTLTSIYMTLKQESGFSKFLWILLILILPFIGSSIGILNYSINKKKIKAN